MENNEMPETETKIETETTENTPPPAGHIQDVGMLDLRSAKTPEDLSKITRIQDVGCILIAPHLTTALAGIPMQDVGTIIPVPEGANIKLRMGQTYLTGESLAAGNPEDTLYIIGQLFITTPVTSVGYKEISVHGQMFAVRGSEGVIGAKLGDVQGQTLYLPAGARTLTGNETLSGEFLELLPEPVAFIVMGCLTIEDDVTRELLKSKVLEFVLMGEIRVPKHLLALVQVLTKEKMGAISVKDVVEE
jgi:hypothetical protein